MFLLLTSAMGTRNVIASSSGLGKKTREQFLS